MNLSPRTGLIIALVIVITCSSECYSTVENNSVFNPDGNTATLSLKTYDNFDSNEQAFSQLIVIPGNKTVKIEVTDVPQSPTTKTRVKFLIVQIHAYQYNLTLSYDEKFTPRRYTFGTNLGLVIHLVDGEATAPFTYVKNHNEFDVQTLLAVVAYPKTAPVPGGCNMEFDTEIAPYQKLSITDSTVIVDIQPAASPESDNMKVFEVPCEKNGLQHDMYRLFFPEQDFTIDSYFSTIKDSLTVQGILSKFRKIPPSISGSKMRRVYSAYPGTGSLYAAVAVNGNNTAAYVPAFTYACSPLYWTDTCQVLTSPFSKVLCAVALFLGFFTAFLGHKYFKTEMFLLGFLSGGLLSYIIIAVVGNYGPSGNIGISVIVGLVLGLTWLGFWWLYAIPVLSILLATLTLGFFCASIAYFSSPAGTSYLENDTNFWLLFTVIILCVPLSLSVVPYSANIICCAILGSYAVVISIDYYAGSNLKYIIINTMRRATSPGFNLAVIYPPYQTKDVCLTVFWVFLATTGICLQLIQNRGRPPFPPGMPGVSSSSGATASSSTARSRNLANERTPLLVESRIPIESSQGDDDVFETPRNKWYDNFFQIFKPRGG